MTKCKDSPRAAHNRRVAAYCDEIANVLAIAPDGRERLRAISLGGGLQSNTQRGGLQVLIQDLGVDHSEISLDLPPSTVASNSTGLDPQLATIFEMATAFDNELEFSGYLAVPLPYDFETREYDTFENPAYSFVISTLRPLSKADLVNIAPNYLFFRGSVWTRSERFEEAR